MNNSTKVFRSELKRAGHHKKAAKIKLALDESIFSKGSDEGDVSSKVGQSIKELITILQQYVKNQNIIMEAPADMRVKLEKYIESAIKTLKEAAGKLKSSAKK